MSAEKNITPWFEVSVEGLRKTLERKGKLAAIYELVQNSWDEEAKQVSVTLSEPRNGFSQLTCEDNSAGGYADIHTAHTMFAPSYKKNDPEKRGRFNVGEKFVVALCEEATIKSTTGTVIFNPDKTRSFDSRNRTKEGSVFTGKIPMTPAEWKQISQQVQMLIPPPGAKTIFNEIEISVRRPLKTFSFTLPTEISDANGVMKVRNRKTKIRIYAAKKDETPFLYEQGIPVVENGTKWHIDIGQKIPLNTDRDNVTEGYKKLVYVSVLNEMADFVQEDDASEAWVSTAMSATRHVSEKAVKKVIKARFGDKAYSRSVSDVGSNKEAVSHGATIVPSGAMSKKEWDSVRKFKALKAAHSDFSTDFNGDKKPAKVIPPEEYTKDERKLVEFVKTIGPILTGKKLNVSIIKDREIKCIGDTSWAKRRCDFRINLAYCDTSDWVKNYDLVIHELTHKKHNFNDHLDERFWRGEGEVGAKLVLLALAKPQLFPALKGKSRGMVSMIAA